MTRVLERTFASRAPAGAAWAHLSAVTGWPSWARHIRRVTLDPDGPLTEATRGRILVRPGLPSTFVMTRLDAPRSWSWRGRFLGTVLDYDHVVEPAADGTSTITFTIDASGTTARAVAPVFARVYGRLLDRAIPGLVAELDALGA